jgi:hypothetical protein
VVAVWLLRRQVAGELNPAGQLGLAVASTWSTWSAVFGALAFARTRTPPLRSVWRYLERASFWVYLIDVPVVGLLQVLLTPFPLPPVLKLLAVPTGGLSVSLGSYHLRGRLRRKRKAVGRALNGSPRIGLAEAG